MIGLTAKQRQLYDFIAARLRETGIAPTCSEICAGLKLGSKSQAHQLLTQLEDRRAIRRLSHRPRAIELVATGEPVTLHPEVRAAATAYAHSHGIDLSTAIAEAARAYFIGDKAA